MDDARRAAAVLGAEGAAKVLVFGSVARGDQRNGSDIDLVAVFDDLDYSETFVLRRRLVEAAQQAAGCDAEVEVFVTDRPEWAHRTRNVASSFEAHIALAAAVLFDRPAAPGAVRWDKQISRPADDRAEGRARFKIAVSHLLGVAVEVSLSEHQMQMVEEMGAGSARDFCRGRMWEVCRASSMAARSAMGAVVAVEGRYARRDLDVAQLADTLTPKHRAVADAARALDAAEVERWWGVCNSYECREVLPLDEQAGIALALAGPAADLVAAAADVLEALGGEMADIDRARWDRSYIRDCLRDYDIVTGRPLPAKP